MCSGFVYVRPTPMVLLFLEAWHKAKQDPSHPVRDQVAFNHVLKKRRYATKLKHVALMDRFGIPNGRTYFERWKPLDGDSDAKRAYKEQGVAQTMIVHNNFVRGYDRKQRRFKQNGMWKLSKQFQKQKYICGAA